MSNYYYEKQVKAFPYDTLNSVEQTDKISKDMDVGTEKGQAIMKQITNARAQKLVAKNTSFGRTAGATTDNYFENTMQPCYATVPGTNLVVPMPGMRHNYMLVNKQNEQGMLPNLLNNTSEQVSKHQAYNKMFHYGRQFQIFNENITWDATNSTYMIGTNICMTGTGFRNGKYLVNSNDAINDKATKWEIFNSSSNIPNVFNKVWKNDAQILKVRHSYIKGDVEIGYVIFKNEYELNTHYFTLQQELENVRINRSSGTGSKDDRTNSYVVGMTKSTQGYQNWGAAGNSKILVYNKGWTWVTSSYYNNKWYNGIWSVNADIIRIRWKNGDILKGDIYIDNKKDPAKASSGNYLINNLFNEKMSTCKWVTLPTRDGCQSRYMTEDDYNYVIDGGHGNLNTCGGQEGFSKYNAEISNTYVFATSALLLYLLFMLTTR